MKYRIKFNQEAKPQQEAYATCPPSSCPVCKKQVDKSHNCVTVTPILSPRITLQRAKFSVKVYKPKL